MVGCLGFPQVSILIYDKFFNCISYVSSKYCLPFSLACIFVSVSVLFIHVGLKGNTG